MRVYISVDMEGIAGIATFNQIVRGNSGYPRAQALMTAETNAAVAGAFDGGATSVTVNDSHGTMDNLLHEGLDRRARLVFGKPKAECMAEGLDDGFDVALFVGYHAPAGECGLLAHTFSSHFTEVRLNGERASEMSVNALVAASHGVPVGLVTGDDVIARLAREQLVGVETVEVKTALGWSATNTVHPEDGREAVRAGAAAAVAKAATLRPVELPDGMDIEIDMPNQSAAELAALIPGVSRRDDRTVVAHLTDPVDVVGLISVCYELSASAQAARMSLLNRV